MKARREDEENTILSKEEVGKQSLSISDEEYFSSLVVKCNLFVIEYWFSFG